MESSRWEARPKLAFLVRAAVVIVPAVVGALVAWGMASALPEPEGFGETLGWLAALIGVTVAAVLLTQALGRRFLPLAWLLSLSLVFPDRTVSRMKAARRAATRRGRRHALDDVVAGHLGASGDDPGESALVLVAALSAHDRRTRGHSEKVRVLADLLAEEAGVSVEDRDHLRWGALLHDIGKLRVSPAILNKPGRPDPDEWAELQTHPDEGRALIEPLRGYLGPWAGAVYEHHERWDGSGYPKGLAGEEISLGGRILAIADAYEVMTATRSYKKPHPPWKARGLVVEASGTHFDPGLVRAFMRISMGKLWWLTSFSVLLAQLPVFGKLWASPAGASVRKTGSGPAVAASAVAALALAGVISPSAGPQAPISSAAAKPAATAPAAAPPEPAAAAPATAPAPEPRQEPPAPTAPTVAAPAARRAAPVSVVPVTIPPPAPPSAPPVAAPSPAPTAPASPAPAPAPAPPRQLYASGGRVLAPSLLRLIGLSITETELSLLCLGTPLTQGLDAVVLELPQTATVPGAVARTTGGEVELVFYTSSCQRLDRHGPAAAAAGVPVPSGARYAVLSNRSSVATESSLQITDK